jgi:hypothetical protein
VNLVRADANDQASLARDGAEAPATISTRGATRPWEPIAIRIIPRSCRKRLLLLNAPTPRVQPELREYLLNYPKAIRPQVQSEFYWEKVNFWAEADPSHGANFTPKGRMPWLKQLMEPLRKRAGLTVASKNRRNPAR